MAGAAGAPCGSSSSNLRCRLPAPRHRVANPAFPVITWLPVPRCVPSLDAEVSPHVCVPGAQQGGSLKCLLNSMK